MFIHFVRQIMHRNFINVFGSDFLRTSISNGGYFIKLIFNLRAAHFFPYTTEHRDASLPGLCYRDDSDGDALAATIKPTQIDIRLHRSFSPSQIVSIFDRMEEAFGDSIEAIVFDVNYGGKLLTTIRFSADRNSSPSRDLLSPNPMTID